MITLNLDKEDCRNAAELIDIYLPKALSDAFICCLIGEKEE